MAMRAAHEWVSGACKKKKEKKTVVGLITLKTMNQPAEIMRKNLVVEGDVVLALNVK